MNIKAMQIILSVINISSSKQIYLSLIVYALMSRSWSIIISSSLEFYPLSNSHIIKVIISEDNAVFRSFLYIILNERRINGLMMIFLLDERRKFDFVDIIPFHTIKAAYHIHISLVHYHLMESSWSWSITDGYNSSPCLCLIGKLEDIIKAFLLWIYPTENIHRLICCYGCMSVSSFYCALDPTK